MTKDPSRWNEQPPAPGTPEARAARGLAALSPPRPLDPDARARLAARLAGTPPVPPAPRIAPIAVGAVLALVMGTGGYLALRSRRVDPAPAAPAVALPSPQPMLPPPPPSDAVAVASVQPPVRRPRPVRTPSPSPVEPKQVLPPVEDAPSSLEREARSLAEIVRTLREGRDPAGALVALQSHRAAFPAPLLGPETDVVELDALVARGDRPSALELLQRLDPSQRQDLPRRHELLALWADLLAEDARCNRAAPLYAQLLEEARGPALQERALWGQAHCLGRQGEVAATRAALEEYLRRFPQGKFAPAARRQLER